MPSVVGTFPDTRSALAALEGLRAHPARPRLTVVVPAANDGVLAPSGVRCIHAAAGDGIQNRTETTTAGALLGLFVAGLVVYAPAAYGFVQAWMVTGPLRAAAGTAAESLFEFPSSVVAAALVIGAVVGGWIGRGFGLPRSLAYRYSLQLRRGRVLASARVPVGAVDEMVEWFRSAGASDIRASDGRLRLRLAAQSDSLDLPTIADGQRADTP